MNCATPWAPAGLIALVLKLLSRQIRRVRKPTGNDRLRAAPSIMRQSASVMVSVPPVGEAACDCAGLDAMASGPLVGEAASACPRPEQLSAQNISTAQTAKRWCVKEVWSCSRFA
jgi:hypothetical protein